MLKRARLLSILAGLSLMAALVVAAWLGHHVPPAATTRLPDGSVVILEAVTWGAETRTRGSLWQKLLHAILPTGLKERSGLRVYRGSTPGTLTFWTIRRGGPQVRWGDRATVFNESGCEGEMTFLQGGGGVERYEFRAFPRRGRTVGLRLYERAEDRWECIGELTAPNPAPGPHPVWAPPPLTITRRSGELELRLTGLTGGIRPQDLELELSPGEEYWLATLHLTENWKATHKWKPSLHSVTDATGNTWSPNAVGSVERGEAHELFFAGPLWTSENAWKLRIRLTRTPEAEFIPDELWTVRNIPIPSPGRTVPLGSTATVQGIPLEITGIYGPRALLPDVFHTIPLDDAPLLIVAAPPSPAADLHRAPIRVTDDRGRPVPVQSLSDFAMEDRSWQVFRLETLPGARSVDFTYAVHRVRYVEFLAPKSTLP